MQLNQFKYSHIIHELNTKQIKIKPKGVLMHYVRTQSNGLCEIENTQRGNSIY